MSVAKFVAANGREALRQVREAMGPDAVVLSNRTVDGGVEIVAMRDTDLGAISDSAPRFQPPVREPIQVAAVEHIDGIRGELQTMRALIERQLSGIAVPAVPAAAADPLRESLFEWLVGAGFSAQLARTLLARLPAGHDRPAAMGWIRQEIASKVPVLADEDALFGQGGVLALVGPTGVGKTTTTAKLAARFVLKHGADKLALLTTDTFRIGAHEQLRIYGDILGVPVHAVKDASDLRLALGALSQKHLVIIDTVGMSQRDRNLSEQIAMLAGAPAPVQRVLLLNGASHGDTLNEVVHAYRHDAAPGAGIDGCIISKLDEATHLGSVLDVVIRHRLPVFYASTGQRVPEHLELARGDALVERAFLMPRRGSVFADAQAARRALAAPAGDDVVDAGHGARNEAHDVLRSIADSGHAVGACVNALSDGPYGFALLRELWAGRGQGQAEPAELRPLVRQVRDAVCQDASRHCEHFVLSASVTLPCAVPGRRAPQPWQHTLWLGDRDGMPLMATVTPLARTPQAGGWDTEMADWRAALAARRTVVHLLDTMPAGATLQRWQSSGERWLAAARKSTRVLCDGTAWKLDALADTLTFHAQAELRWRDRDAVQWVAQTRVRVIEGQTRAARGTATEGGIEAVLLVARTIERDSGQTLAVDYLLADPALAGAGAQLAQWARWGEAAALQCRTLRHALDHLGRPAGTSQQAFDVDALVALQAGMTALRLAHAPAQAAIDCLAGLAGQAGRSAARDAVPGAAALLEGLGRLLALLDVLENFPGRNAAAVGSARASNDKLGAGEAIEAIRAATPAANHALTDAELPAPALPESAQHLAQRMTQNAAGTRENASAKFDLAALGD
ncbi:flagellar biosynthesis protein FlhF [Cupriavidus gilardii]|uniref:flagellar biosynthesis protein FlhF n=1 Tax=Cupriavidus gilardii TaxID=82541 RepID=UPI0021C24971|nr:flagellar biosynthesis protein FlhF [Cupriavidus gilardii]MCT9116049.1 flagellar biosynthesis protein FlhF [Cupriavidus gilardii]